MGDGKLIIISMTVSSITTVASSTVKCFLQLNSLPFSHVQEEEADLSEAFKRRLGVMVSGVQTVNAGQREMLVDETARELGEIALPAPAPAESRDVEREATLTRARFDKFARALFTTKNAHVHHAQPLSQPLLAKKHQLDHTVAIASTHMHRAVPATATGLAKGGPGRPAPNRRAQKFF